MASKNSIALDEEMKGEVVVVAMKEVYKENGIPCCPGSETGSGKAVYCIKGKNESDAYVTERTKFLDRVHSEYVNATGDNTIIIGQNKRLRLEEPLDFLTYHLLLLRDDIAPSISEYNKSRHIGYFVNEEKESQEFVDNTEKIQIALGYLEKCSMEIIPNIAMYCNLPYNGKLNVINGKVRRVAIENPSKIIEFFESKELSIIIYLQTLMLKGLIKRSNGTYMYDGAVLGSTMNQMVAYVNDDRNAIILEKMNRDCPYNEYKFGEESKDKE